MMINIIYNCKTIIQVCQKIQFECFEHLFHSGKMINTKFIYRRHLEISNYTKVLFNKIDSIYKIILNAENESFGGICSQNDQCISTTICRKGRCVCRPEYVFIDDDRYKSTFRLTLAFISPRQCKNK